MVIAAGREIRDGEMVMKPVKAWSRP